MSDARLIYLPLGGAGEIGMNCYVYGYGKPGAERLIVVDMGVTFPDMDGTPGVDLILPDITWLKENKNRIEAMFITHAHEDHVGAVGHTFGDLSVPIYARAFTANLARQKLAEYGVEGKSVRTCSAWPETVTVGPFTVGFLPISHSIPESSGLVIDSPAGRVLHTGDFKLDTQPLVGEPWDPELWAEVSKGGVKALVCDSTNVFNRHPGRSEVIVGPAVEKLVSEARHMVVATTFASNVARVKTLAEAGERAGRSICTRPGPTGRGRCWIMRRGPPVRWSSTAPTDISPRTSSNASRASWPTRTRVLPMPDVRCCWRAVWTGSRWR